jgi:hypothetical protein
MFIPFNGIALSFPPTQLLFLYFLMCPLQMSHTRNHCLQDRPSPVLNDPRVKFPDYKDKHLFQLYRDEIDAKVKSNGLHNRIIDDDISFVSLYSDLTNVVNLTAARIFGRIKRRKPLLIRSLLINSSNSYKAALMPSVALLDMRATQPSLPLVLP